jgi:acetyltransferase EpsM
MSKRLVILGAGGDGLVVAEAIAQLAGQGGPEAPSFVGFLDDAYSQAGRFEGFSVLGTIDKWTELEEDIAFVPAIQKVGDMPRRAARLDGLGIPLERWATVVHPTAMVAASATIGAGVYIAAFCSVQPRCVVDDFSTLRAGAALGHDAKVSRHGYVGPNAVMCGRTTLGEGSHLGPGAVLLDNRQVGEFSVVGVASAVTKDVAPYSIVMGNPAKRIGPARRAPAPASKEE